METRNRLAKTSTGLCKATSTFFARTESAATSISSSSCQAMANTQAPYYETLGIAPNTPFPDIRAAYLKLAKQYNPKIESNNAKFMEITEAFQMIKRNLQAENGEGACNLSSRLHRVFEKVFAITAEPMENPKTNLKC